jgi:endonuclease-3
MENSTKRALKIIKILEKEYPEAKTALRYKNPWQLLVSTILSAQCTDKRVNKVTKKLFKKYTDVKDYANVYKKELEQDIKSTGFYKQKAKYLKESAKMVIEKFDSKVPRTMEDLIQLPGVARKTANIVLTNAFDVVEGIAVDTHVRRLSIRLDLSENKNPDKIEKDLMELFPKDKWEEISDLLIFHGRRICNARNPNCDKCVLNKLCPSAFTFD